MIWEAIQRNKSRKKDLWDNENGDELSNLEFAPGKNGNQRPHFYCYHGQKEHNAGTKENASFNLNSESVDTQKE